MSAPFNIIRLAGSAAHLRHHRLALSGIIALTLALGLGSTVLTPAALRIFASSSAKDHTDLNGTGSALIWDGSPWAGGLELPRPEGQATNPRQPEPLTSASYTSGFDKEAAGLGPLPAKAPPMKLAQPRDPRVCPDDLNCSFRPAKAGGVPPPRPLVAANAEPVKISPPPTGLALLTANSAPACTPARTPAFGKYAAEALRFRRRYGRGFGQEIVTLEQSIVRKNRHRFFATNDAFSKA